MEIDGIIFTAKSPKKKEIKRKTTFFKCRVCGLMHFPTEKDKKNWEFIEKRQNESMKCLIDDIRKKCKICGKKPISTSKAQVLT